jgi:DNA-binding GntR family transcriptional regulator
MTQLAAVALRSMILAGELRPGDRVVENQLTETLGVSKPPLREAMRVLEQEGLIVRTPRRGAVVTPLTLHDVYEIFTLRHSLERLAIDLGVPSRSPARVERCRDAYAALARAAEDGDAAAVTERGFEFHLAVVGLAGHRRIEDAYRALALQLQLCMGMNRQARRSRETLLGDALRHRGILELIESGDTDGLRHELVHHGDKTFLLDAHNNFPGGSPESLAWLESVRRLADAHDRTR